MNSKEEKALIARIIKLHGPVIDLRTSPGVLIDILRRFDEPPDGGTPCGGVPPAPGPSPSSAGTLISNDDLMRAILKLSREVASIKKSLTAKAPTRGKVSRG